MIGRICIPGNLLLLGEYAVLESGGLGLTMAIKPHVVARISTAARFSLSGVTPAVTERWNRGCSNDTFVCRIAEALAQTVQTRAGVDLAALPMSLTIDSTAFFDAAGAKRGLGSSAAASVALVAAVVRQLRSINPAAADRIDPLQTAVSVHRAAQNGHGSGYDVAASLYGGVGLFRGGPQPSYTALGTQQLPRLFLRPGPAAVSTRAAIGRYQELKHNRPAVVRQFLESSNRALSAFADAHGWCEQRAALLEARSAAAALGDTINVPARPAVTDHRQIVAKCLGAGNELVALFVDPLADAAVLPQPPAFEVSPCTVEGL